MGDRNTEPVPDEGDEDDVEGEGEIDVDVVDLDTGNVSKKKGSGSRGPKWKTLEDECLCDAWAAVILDPITGTNQTAGKYYKRIFDQFNERKRYGEYASIFMSCTESALSHRWATIKKGCNKFHGYLETAIRRKESGKTMVDYVSLHKCLSSFDLVLY